MSNFSQAHDGLKDARDLKDLLGWVGVSMNLNPAQLISKAGQHLDFWADLSPADRKLTFVFLENLSENTRIERLCLSFDKTDKDLVYQYEKKWLFLFSY